MADELSPQEPSRIPGEEDLISLCRELNAREVKYIVVGGFAVIHHGYLRATEDIDLLLDESLENQSRVKQALQILPDKAILELGDDDLRDYVVVRVADEVLVDLMLSACGVTYEEAKNQVEIVEIRGVPITFANPELLLRMKQTHREKDIPDRIFFAKQNRGQRTGFIKFVEGVTPRSNQHQRRILNQLPQLREVFRTDGAVHDAMVAAQADIQPFAPGTIAPFASTTGFFHDRADG